MDCWVALGSIGSLIGGLATFVLAYVAVNTRNAWLEQKQADVAEKLLVQSTLVRDVLKQMFYPFARHGEPSRMPQMEGETENSWGIRKSRRWREVTYQDNYASIQELRAVAIRAGAVLGKDFQDKAFWMLHFVDDILAAGREMQAFIESHKVRDESDHDARKRKYAQIEGRQWSDIGKLKTMDEVYAEIETLCRKKLRAL